MTSVGRFRDFVQDFTRLVEKTGNDEALIFVDGKALLEELVTHDDCPFTTIRFGAWSA
jgi:hypothetical protein